MKRRLVTIVICLGCPVATGLARAQGASCSAPGQNTATCNSSSAEIDGSQTPNLIPDTTAYFLVMLSLVPPDPGNREGQFKFTSRLDRITLDDSDRQAFVTVLEDFGREYAAWGARGATAIPADRDEIVGHHILMITQRLSDDGGKRVRAYVVGEKRNMRMPQPTPGVTQ